MKRAPLAIAIAALLTFAFTGGGRITGSDEIAQLNFARSFPWRIDIPPEGSTLQGHDGRFYTKNTAGQAILALPLVKAGALAARVAGFQGARAELASRFIPSFFNGIVGALLLAAAYTVMRSFRLSSRASLMATIGLGFTTPTWITAKGFAAEPIEALGMLLALGGGARAGAAPSPEDQRRGERWAGVGAFLAIFVKLGVAPMVLACLAAIGRRRPRAWLLPLTGIVASFGTHAIYNWMRFRNAFESGYGSQQSFEAFSTPLRVGAYGLLFSSGKGVAWFAPMMWLAPLGFAAMLGAWKQPGVPPRGEDTRHAAWAIALAWAAGICIYGRFEHWGGDGSWGPRYLAPLLPLGAVAVAFALDGASKWVRWSWRVLAPVGLLVTLGGVGIYFGAEMREVGDYPYKLPLSDPRFMHASHWEWHQSPILVSWKMLSRNVGEHVRGRAPEIGKQTDVDPRTGISNEESGVLTHAIDLWWLYAGYAGLPKVPLGIAAILLLVAAVFAWRRAWHAVCEDTA